MKNQITNVFNLTVLNNEPMINESDLAELIFSHALQDFQTYIALSQVSKRFNEFSKRQLICKEKINPDGTKEIWTELPTGSKHGLQRKWYTNGQLHYECNYRQGQKHGLQRGWYTNGQLGSESNHHQGQLHGLQRRWYYNGQLCAESNYHQGQLHGLHQEWYSNGQLWSESNYHQGQLIENLNN